MLCSGRRRTELGGGIRGVGRALVINRYARHSEKLTEIYDVQIYGGKQKGRDRKNRKRPSKRYMEGEKRENAGFIIPMRRKGPQINSP